MIKLKSKYIAFTVSAILMISVALPANASAASTDQPSKTVVKVTPGVGKIDVDGVKLPSAKPYKSGNILYIPLSTVMEAFGADVIWLGNNKINVAFQDISAELTVNTRQYTVNQTKKTLSAPPVVKNGAVMVPSNFISGNFNITEKVDSSTGADSFVLKDDGELTDLSFLTGGVNKPRVGNSYFGWSLAVPSGSTIATQSFNSKTVEFQNEYHMIAIDIDVTLTEGKTLAEYYKSIKDDPNKTIMAELIDSRLSTGPGMPYIELLYTDDYDEAIYHRIYVAGDYFYNIIVTSFNESDPSILKNDKSITGISDSLKLDYKGGDSATTDISSVNHGLAKYTSYVTSTTSGKKYPTWAISILPDWDQIQTGDTYLTEFGPNTKKYVSVEVSSSDGKTSEEAGKALIDSYTSNFNPSLFSIKSSGASTVAGKEAYSILYSAKSGKDESTYDERLLISDGLSYDITFKAPSDEFEKDEGTFETMLKTFSPYTDDADTITAEIEKYKFNNEKNRLGKDDSPVLSENKTFSWSISLPGHWQKTSTSGQGTGMDSFTNQVSGGVIMVESVAKKANSSSLSDNEKFSLVFMPVKDLTPVKNTTIQAKGMTVKEYVYRLDDEEGDTHADITYYILDEKDYSYCYMSSLPDLTSSGTNLKEMADAWDSFTIVE